ncbi:MAG: 3-dehydroquinate synthase [Planctomycetes bacterium]|nr:3-dehydroquinate synthase [Planctomycetota bacterium]
MSEAERELSWRHERGATGLRLGSGAFERVLGGTTRRFPSAPLLVVDESVLVGHRARLGAAAEACGGASIVALPGGEHAKRFAELERVLEACAAARLPRDGLLIAIGGGACTDLAGLAAALWMRGVAWVAVPTTLLALVDASVGGKTAINLGAAKNLVGTFHAPCEVALDPSFLATLPGPELRSGLAEVVKAALLSADDSFAELERFDPKSELSSPRWLDVIERAVRLKVAVVERDERESGPRRALNLGHTLAHGLEQERGFGVLRHGDAVAIGLVAACDFAVARGLLRPEQRARVVALLARFGLPLAPPRDLEVAAVLRALQLDKKIERGRLRYVLPCGLPAATDGAVAFVDDLSLDEIERWLYSSIETSSSASQ